MRKEPTEIRFWRHVEKTKTCWLWTGTIRNGYGRIRHDGKMVTAHKFSFEMFNGPTDKILDHLCRVRNCVNPAHLNPTTSKQNILIGIAPTAINHRKTHCVHGHEFNKENTIIRKNNGGRDCRQCLRKRAREYMRKNYVPRQ